MEYESYDLNDLYRLLPEYVNTITEKRKYKKYNCPLCNSGARENGTPAFNLYDDNLKCHCFSCGFDGNIIGLYLAVNDMADTKENIAVAIRALGKSFGLIPQYGTAPTKAKKTQPRFEIGSREHIYHYADGSIFGKKTIKKYSDGSKTPFWQLYNPQSGCFDICGLLNQKAPLYHADRLHQDTTTPTVIFVEGEKDVETIERIADGAEILATSTPNGAGQTAWPDLYNADLSGREIVVITDNDEAGEKYGHTVAVNLHKIAKSVRIIPTKTIWPDCPEKADISDAVEALGADETAQRLGDAIQKAEIYSPEQTTEKVSNTHIPKAQILTTKKAYEFSQTKKRFIWYPYIPAGDFTVLMAAGGEGKTYFSCGIAATISKGEPLPVPNEYLAHQTTLKSKNVLIISAEDEGGDLQKRLLGAGADLRYIDIADKSDSNGFLFPENSADTARIEAFRGTFEKCKPELIIIDPWHAFLPPSVDVNRINHVRPVFQTISALCKEFDCGLILISHINKKAQEGNANFGALGSVDFINASRSAMKVITDSREKSRRIVVHTKTNHAGFGQSVAFTIDDTGFAWDGFEPDVTKETLEDAARQHRKPLELLKDKPDYTELKKILLDIITELAEIGKETEIAYKCLEDMCEDKTFSVLASVKRKELIDQISTSEAFRSRGMSLKGYKTGCKYVDSDTGTQKYGRGFIVSRMINGYEMAAAMPK